MIFNYKRNYPGSRTIVTDAVHIYAMGVLSQMADEIVLTWRPGDAVEYPTEEASSFKGDYVRAASTLLIDSGALTTMKHVYIPYATALETFNYQDKDADNDNYDDRHLTQTCFKTGTDGTIVHVNTSLYTYMSNNSTVWGDIMTNVVVDQ